jgi:hypothetical protein
MTLSSTHCLQVILVQVQIHAESLKQEQRANLQQKCESWSGAAGLDDPHI